MGTLKIGILVSGSGTNLQAILDAVGEHSLDAEIRLVISNVPNVLALERARLAGVPHKVISHRDFANRELFDQALVDELRQADVEWVVLAGFMRVLTPTFLLAFERRIINIHPALLPAFPGTHAQKQALDYGVKFAGCTVHFVDAGVDTGPIIAQRVVPVLDDDDESRLSQRILEQEHQLLVEVLRWLAAGRVRVTSDARSRSRVVITAP
ncbi:MAG TPA: phosphoribosylglycinamide formyltransferase [Polyangiaceae bacterium]|nr:phosphoribosylglycinamide formyltransferase [Polyangiaceae bacterium]